MITIKRYKDEDREIWNKCCRNSKAPMFIFEREFMEYHKHRFCDHSLIFYNEDGEIIALLPCNESNGELFSHAGLTYGGFITNTKMKQHIMNDCFDILVDYAKKNGFQAITYKAVPHIFHKQPAEEDRYALFRHNAKILKVEPATVVNLEQPLKMPKGRKSQISRAIREGIEVKELFESDDYHSFMNLENQVLKQHHNATAVHSGDEMYLLYSRFPEHIHLYGAFYKDELIAGSVIYEYGQTIHTTYLAANDVARKNGALDLTIKTMLDRYQNEKKWFDFGISTENGGLFMNEGLISQKEGFGGRTDIYDTWIITIK